METRLAAILSRCAGFTDTPLPPPESQVEGPPIRPEGPLDARIVIVGDTPTPEAWGWKKNFEGRTLAKLDAWLRFAKIDRRRCFVTHVYPLYPPGGTLKNVPESELSRWRSACLDLVMGISPRPEVIVCLGNEALYTFTGLRDITRRRGSVYQWEGIKVVGIIPPGVVLKRKEYEQHSRRDMERVKYLTTSHTEHHDYCPCAKPRKRNHITPYTVEYEELLREVAYHYTCRADNPDAVLSIDIETPLVEGKRQLFCVGFALGANEGLVLPWEGYQEEIAMLCGSPCQKVGHNFVSFDWWWLARAGIHVEGRVFDTLCLSHALNPASRHSLEFLQSIYTFEPWHKDQGKGHDFTVIEKNIPDYMTYCSMDACVTHELFTHFLHPLLEERQLTQFYEDNYEKLFAPVRDLMLRGVPIDHDTRQSLLYDLLLDARTARDRLGEINGAPLFTLNTRRDRAVYSALMHGKLDELRFRSDDLYTEEAIEKSLETITKKTVSGAQLKSLLYDKLGLATQYKRRSTGDLTVTADGVTLKRLKREHPDRPEVAEVINLAMEHNTNQKLATFLYPHTFDDTDGRFRFSLKFNTEASRFASSQAPDGLGRNSQNSPRDKRIRSIVIPEKGHILYEADASQIEGRLCFIYTKDPELTRLARLRSSEFDQHRYVVSILPKKAGTYFGYPMLDIPPKSAERQVAKSINHAAMRAMQARTAVDTLLKQDERFVYTEGEMEVMLEAYHIAFPAIRVWQASIRKEIRTKRALTSSCGHTWDVRYEEVNDDLFRRAYSWKMQRDCAALTNLKGFIPVWYWMQRNGMQSRVLLQEHDSLVFSCPIEEVYDVAAFLTASMESPVEYDGVALSVPLEHKIGRNWGDTYEYADLPERAAFEAKAREFLTERR